jgi:DNA-binding NarL/FixJ family response regulator
MLRVAVIEDDPAMRARLAEAIGETSDLTFAGSASNMAEAEILIDSGGYDVLLCDLGLPDGSGIDLIKRETLTERDTDILVITIFADQNKVLAAIKAGARGYLLKDEHIGDCLAAIREIKRGGSPISPIIARQLLGQIKMDSPEAPKSLVSPLSEREYEVLNLLSRGFSYSECAEILAVSINTVGSHVKNIYRKLEVNSRAEALFEASSQGLLGQKL